MNKQNACYKMFKVSGNHVWPQVYFSATLLNFKRTMNFYSQIIKAE